MTSTRLQSLNIFLLRDGVRADDALRPGRHHHQSIRLGDTDADLYMKRSPADQPDWVTFLGAAVPPSWQFRSVSAVLFFASGGRTFAIPFGAGGRFMLDPNAYEEGFGLKVALNSVEPDMVRGLGVSTLGGYGVRSDRQASRDAPCQPSKPTSFATWSVIWPGRPGGSRASRPFAGVTALA